MRFKLILLYVLLVDNLFSQNELLSIDELKAKTLYQIGYNEKSGFTNSNLHDSLFAIGKLKMFDSLNRIDSIKLNQKREDIYRISIKRIYSNTEDELTIYLLENTSWENAFELIKSNFPNLQELTFDGVMSYIPNSLFDVKKLQIINLNVGNCDNCQLKFCTIPTDFKKLEHLKKLKITGLSWTFIPSDFLNFENIDEVFIGIQNDTEFFSTIPASFFLSKAINKNSYFDFKEANTIAGNLLFYYRDSTNNRYYYDAVIEESKDEKWVYTKTSKNKFQLKYNDTLILLKGEIDSKNQPHGTWKLYFESGKIKEIRHYNHGQECDNWKIYDDLGNLKSKYHFRKNKISFSNYRKNGLLDNKFYVFRDNDSSNYRLYKTFRSSLFLE